MCVPEGRKDLPVGGGQGMGRDEHGDARGGGWTGMR